MKLWHRLKWALIDTYDELVDRLPDFEPWRYRLWLERALYLPKPAPLDLDGERRALWEYNQAIGRMVRGVIPRLIASYKTRAPLLEAIQRFSEEHRAKAENAHARSGIDGLAYTSTTPKDGRSFEVPIGAFVDEAEDLYDVLVQGGGIRTVFWDEKNFRENDSELLPWMTVTPRPMPGGRLVAFSPPKWDRAGAERRTGTCAMCGHVPHPGQRCPSHGCPCTRIDSGA